MNVTLNTNIATSRINNKSKTAMSSRLQKAQKADNVTFSRNTSRVEAKVVNTLVEQLKKAKGQKILLSGEGNHTVELTKAFYPSLGIHPSIGYQFRISKTYSPSFSEPRTIVHDISVSSSRKAPYRIDESIATIQYPNRPGPSLKVLDYSTPVLDLEVAHKKLSSKGIKGVLVDGFRQLFSRQ